MRRVTVKWDRDHSRTAFAVLLAIIITAGLAVFATGCTDAEGDAVSRSNGVAAMAGGAALEAQATSTSVSWNGVNGADKNCAQGGTLHWILTTGGNADIVSGSLTVTFQGGGSQTVDGQFPGGGGGAMHFYTTGDSPVTAAVANYSYEGTQNNVVLTISSSVCNTTTTTESPTTTTEPPTTTTTTTTEPPTTTAPPTTAPPTTAPPTTAPPTTAPPTTVLPTTTTPTSEVTTTTTAPPTPTTLDEVTSTTAPSTTTSSTPNTTTGPATSVPTTGGVSTTQGGATTAPSVSLIHTGGGGTAGAGAGRWALMILAGCLAVALGASAIAVRVRGK